LAILTGPSARTLLAIASAVGLCATLGCQLSRSDVVSRPPNPAYASGGSNGQDAQVIDEPDDDTALLDLLGADGAGSAEDASEIDGNGAESKSGLDTADASAGQASDTPYIGEAEGGSDVADECSAEGYEFCENFEDGAALWVSAGGPWDVIQETGPAGAGSGFVSLAVGEAETIAYVPIGVWQDMTVEADVMVTSFGPNTSSNRAEIYARYQTLGSFYALGLRSDGKLGLRRNASGLGTVAPVSIAENQWHTLKLRVSGSAGDVNVEGYLDGTLLTTAIDTSDSPDGDNGTVGVGVHGLARAVFDNVKVSSP
jgi:hypothetical protein